jgi:hypothetical protein
MIGLRRVVFLRLEPRAFAPVVFVLRAFFMPLS